MRTAGIVGLALALALPAAAQHKAPRDDKEVVRFVTEKNIFAPWKPKPKTVARPKQTGAATQKKEPPKEVREELLLTGIFFDNTGNSYQAIVETRDGEKKKILNSGDSCGLYKIQVILFDRLGLVHGKTGKKLEVHLGESFEGEVSTGKAASGGGQRSRPAQPSPALPKVNLTQSKREEILRRLRERARRSRNKKGK